MSRPAKIKSSNDRPETEPWQGIEEYSTSLGAYHEIQFRTGQQILYEFVASVGVASLQVGTSGAPANFTSIGTFTDSVRDDAVGTHPTNGDVSTVNTYTFSQGTSTATDGKTFRPLRINDDGDQVKLEEMTDSEIDTEILDLVIEMIVEQQQYGLGQYRLEAVAPSSNVQNSNADVGTWTSRGTVSDTQVDGTTVTKTLWQKTGPRGVLTSTGNGSRLPIKFVGEDIQEVTTTELKTLVGRLRNRILSTNIGRYVFDTAAPTTGGTWQQMGETMTNQIKSTATYAYAGTYTGSYSGNYTGTYTGYYSGDYTGTYTLFYSGSVGGYFDGTYTGTYEGTYDGTYTGSYSGNYTGYYDGVTIISTSSTQESKKLFVRIA